MSKSSISGGLLYVLFFCYPILPVNYYIGPLNYANICAILIVFTYLFYSKGKIPTLNLLNNNLGFWAFWIVYVLFIIFTASPLKGFASLVANILVPIVIINTINSENHFLKILDFLIFSSVILSIIGLIESLSGHYFFQEILFGGSDKRYGILRCTGPFGHPINFGIYQAIVALITFYKINCKYISSRKKVFYILSYISSIISIFLSVSRLAICLFVAGQCFLLIKLKVSKIFKYLSIVLIFTLLGLMLMNSFGFSFSSLFNDFVVSLVGIFDSSKNSSNSNVVGFGNRFDLYRWVFDSVSNNKLLGMGINAEFSHRI